MKRAFQLIPYLIFWCSVATGLSAQQKNTPLDSSIDKRKLCKFNYSGRITLEGFHTNFQNPRMLNQATYLRLSTRQTLSFCGIPIGLDGFYSSEPQSVYASNYLRFYLDKDALRTTWEKQKQTALSGVRTRTEQIKSIIESKKTQLSNLQLQSNDAIEQLALKRNDLQMQQTKWQQQYQLRDISDTFDSFKSTNFDPTDDGYWKDRVADSLTLHYLSRDTQQLQQFIGLSQRKISFYKQQISILDSIYGDDTAQLGKLKSGYGVYKNNFKNLAASEVRSRVGNALSGFTQLQVGSAQVLIHPYSLNGTSLRGINIGYSFSRLEAEIAAGTIQSVGIMQFDRDRIPFNRGAGVFKISTELIGLKVGVFGHLIKDFPKPTLGSESFYNHVYGIFASGNIKNGTNIELSAASAGLRVENSDVRRIVYVSGPTNRLAGLSNKAYRMKIEKQLTHNISGEFLTQLVGATFRNLGNPFMRGRFEEQSIKIKGGMWSGRVQLAAFYKRFHDNPGKLEGITNLNQGYGVSIQSRFKKKWLPNFNFSVSPYEQGNNHPDTLLRVNSRFNLITTGVNWRLQNRRFQYYMNSIGSSSVMLLNDTHTVAMQSLSIQQDLMLGKAFSLGLTSTFTRTKPGIDSTQSNTWQLRTLWSGKRLQIMALGHYAQFLNGAYRKGISIIFGSAISQNIRISIKTGFDEYYRLWGLGYQAAWSGLLRAEIKW
jgi:hypothetical protein